MAPFSLSTEQAYSGKRTPVPQRGYRLYSLFAPRGDLFYFATTAARGYITYHDLTTFQNEQQCSGFAYAATGFSAVLLPRDRVRGNLENPGASGKSRWHRDFAI